MMEEYSKFQHEVLDAGNESRVKDFDEVSSDSSPDKVKYVQHEISRDSHDWGENDPQEEPSISNVLTDLAAGLENSFFGSDLLVAELQEASDAIDEMEGKVQVKLMVGEAVLRGLLNALEADASEAVMAKETELQKVREQLKEKDSIVTRLINTLQGKEEELVKKVEESISNEKRLVLDMLTERENVLVKVQESEGFVSSKEKELSEMAQSMVDMAMRLANESKRVSQLEKELKDSKEAEVSKGREIMAMIEKTEQLQADQESAVEVVKREARLKELRLTDSLAEKDELLHDKLHRIETLESAEQGLRDELHMQNKEVARLVQSEKDSSELLTKLTIGNKSAADDLVAAETQVKSLQEDIQLLNKKIQELVAEKSTISEELRIEQEQSKAKDTQILQHRGALQDADVHTQTSSLVEQHLRDEIARMNSNLQGYIEASTHSLQVEMDDQKWKHEYETGIIMETLKGLVADLTREISLLGQDLDESQSETFKSELLQKTHGELLSLRASKASLEMKVKEFNSVIIGYEQNLHEKEKTPDNKLERLEQADEDISHLVEEIKQKELLLQKCKDEIEEMKSQEESMKKQHKDEKENSLLLREAQDRITSLEQEVDLFKKAKMELEETSWMHEFEEKVLSTYVESSFKELQKQIREVQGDLLHAGEKLNCCRKNLEAAQAGDLSKCKLELETIKTDLAAGVEIVDHLQAEVNDYASDLSKAKIELEKAQSGAEKEKPTANDNQDDVAALRNELEALHLKKRDEVEDLKAKLEESEWKSHTQNVIILGLFEGATQERINEFAQLTEDLKVKRQEVMSLHIEVEEQNRKLTAYTSEVSELKAELSSKHQELAQFKDYVDLTSASQRDALVHEQSKLKEAGNEIEELKKLKMMLVARIEEEKQRVKQLEEALAEQKLKHQFDVDVVTTVLYEGGVEIAAAWEKERGVLVSEVTKLQELGGKRAIHEMEVSNQTPRNVQYGSDVLLLEPNEKVELEKNEQEAIQSSPAKAESIITLERKNLELRRENEQLLEQKTEEIYKLKRDFYKEVEKIKEEWKLGGTVSNLSRRLSGLRHEVEIAHDTKANLKPATVEMLTIDQTEDSDSKRGWDSEKSIFLESISQRDEQIKEKDERIKDVSTRLSDALEKERKHVSSRASLVENLAALEKERNGLNSVHDREKEKLVAYYKKILEERDSELRRAISDIEEKNRQIVKLEGESVHAKDEVMVLMAELSTIRKKLQTDFAGQIQALVASSQELGADVARRTKDYNLRLQRAEGLIKYLQRQFSLLSLSETDHMHNVQNLQKAETEVDLLGDEVDALMDILEKVYTVLNHYAPIIQHYPGLAELVKVVKQEVLQRIYDSKDA